MTADRNSAGKTRRSTGKTARPKSSTRRAPARASDKSVATTSVMVSDFAVANPPTIDIPAMICQPEKNFYYWLTSNHATGAGAVVELGTWLGSSTAYLSAGLHGRQMHCYDGFVWSAQYNWKSGIKLESGADFSHIFLDNMKKCGANVVVHQSNIDGFTWDGSPIELLVIDMGKVAGELATLLTIFAPGFVPGQTRISLQDYQYFPGYQISIVMDAIRASVELENVVVAVNSNLQPNTVSFLVTKPIDTAALAEVVDTFKSWSVKRIRSTWARIVEPLPEQARARMAPGLAFFLYDAGHAEAAVEALAETSMDRLMLKRWKRMADNQDFSRRYPELFTSWAEAQTRKVHVVTPSAKAPKPLGAARKVVSVVRQLDPSEQLDGLIAHLAITPQDAAARERLISAAFIARQEQKALDCLIRHDLADLSAPRIESLFKRVYMACKEALNAGDRDRALSCFQTLARADDQHPWVRALRPSLSERAVSAA